MENLARAYKLIEQAKKAVNELEKECILDKPFYYAQYELIGIISIFEKDRNNHVDTELGLILGQMRVVLSMLKQSQIKEQPQQEAIKILAYALKSENTSA